MFCSKCGFNNPDDYQFCQQCGNKLTAPLKPEAEPAPATEPFSESAPAAEPAPAPPVYSNPYPAGNYQPAYTAPVQRAPASPVETVKRLCVSPLFIVAAIAVSVAVFMDLIAAINTASVYSRYGFEGYSIGSFISVAISGLIVAGLWLIFSSARQKAFPGMKTTGFSMIKAVAIVYLVLLSIIFFVAEVLLLTANRELKRYIGYYIDTDELAIVAALLLAGIFTLIIIYYAKIITTISAVQKTVITGIANPRASAFLAVMLFIAAGVDLIRLFAEIGGESRSTNLFGLSVSSGPDAATIISLICIITALICFGALIFKYRGAMNAYVYGGMPGQIPVYQPAYYPTQPPYGYQPPQAPPQQNPNQNGQGFN